MKKRRGWTTGDVVFATFIGVVLMPFGAVLGVFASKAILVIAGRGLITRFGDIDIAVGIAVSWMLGFVICMAITRDELPDRDNSRSDANTSP